MSEIEAAIKTLEDFAPCMCSGGFVCSRCKAIDTIAKLHKNIVETRQAFSESRMSWQPQTIVGVFDKILGGNR